jgi:hypothetical protein
MRNRRIDRRGFLGFAGAAIGGTVASSCGHTACGGESGSPPAAGTCRLPARDVPLLAAYDLVVCGGGPSGIAAALAARRAGVRVLLVEGQGQLGGTSTSGHVSHWLGGRTSDCTRWAVGGIFRSLTEEAVDRGFALLPKPSSTKYQPHGWYQGQLCAGIPFDPFAMAAYLDERMTAAKVDVLLLTQAVDVIVDGDRITHVILHNKSGCTAVPAGAIVDATGDADLAAWSGCEVAKGRDKDGLMTPTSLIFHVDNVDQDALSDYIHEHDEPRFREKIKQLRAAGEWPFPYDIFISVQLQEKGTMMINTVRLVGIDGTDGPSKSRGMAEGRAEIQRLMAIMRRHFAGFENARLKSVAPMLGVRETRRIGGHYVLTVADLASQRRFDDCIGFTAYGWDLPDPKAPSVNPSHGKKPELTPMPYRIMVPRPIENLICPGRAVSVEREVLGPLRVMAPCMAMGEAAGQAAALALAENKSFAEVNAQALRDELRKHGAIVD